MFERLRLRLARAFAPNAMTSHDLYREMLSREWLDEETGLLITPDVAMRLAAVYACVRVVSEDIAALPLVFYERLTRGRQRVADHWLPRLMAQPNEWQTGFEFEEMKQAHIELDGNFYALKTVVRNEIRELLPVPPGRMQAKVTSQRALEYTITWPDGTSQPVPPDRVYHVRGLSLDGLKGISPVRWQRETLGWGRALNKYGSRLFKNGAVIGGVLEHPRTLSDPAFVRLKESFEEKYSGVDNAHKTILLEEGTQFKATGMKATDAEFLSSKKYSRSEIAGMYRVPPHMIADLDRSAFSNIEQQSLDYVQKGLLPRLRRNEARMKLSLIPKEMRDTFYFEYLVDGLLRGDFATRMRGYQTAVLSGWMTRNQVRELENQNPGPAALDEYLVPVSMQTADAINAAADAAAAATAKQAKQAKQANADGAPAPQPKE